MFLFQLQILLTQIDVPIGQLCNIKANESKLCLKCGRLVGLKDTIP